MTPKASKASQARANHLVCIILRMERTQTEPAPRELDPIFESGDADAVIAHFLTRYDECPGLREICAKPLVARHLSLDKWLADRKAQPVQLPLL